jgi:ABC-2 type transport system permease protein
MTTEIARLDLRLRRRGTIGYAIGMAVYVFVIVALYPSFKDDASLNDFTSGNSTLAALFGATGSLTSPVGWMNANVYSNFLPLIVLVITLGYGAGRLAGQDEAATLSLVVTLPRSRRAILWQKAGTLVLVAVPTVVAVWALTLVGRAFDLTLDPAHLTGISLNVLLMGVDFGAIAMLIGAITGTRGEALGIASGVAAAMYLISSLASVVDWVKPLRFLSLFYWAVGDNQLEDGITFAQVGVLVGVAVVVLFAAGTAFDRLDVH